MFSLWVNVYRLLKAVFLGVKSDDEFKILLFLLTVLLIGSTSFYSQFEGWRIIDSLYFSVMTMSTIGYGDLVPVKDISKVFTILFTFLSVGVFVSLNAKIVMIMLNQKKEKHLKRKRCR